MADPTIIERFDSKEATESKDSPTHDLVYMIMNTEQYAVAKNLMASAVPDKVGDLFLDDYHIVHLGNGVWEGTAHYVKWKSESQYSFDTGGGTQHVTQSIANVGKYAATGFTAPDFMGAIGVTDDRVEGTDITVPVFNFTETHYIEKALVTGAYKLALFSLTGKVNGSGFKGFAKGEVLFLGASGSKRGLDDWEITFRFAASPNVAGLSLGSISGISKEGWQYLWVRFIDDEDPTAKALIKRPVSAYVEQVYSYGNFANLGIGV
ncbi:MAG: hypothetical protein ACKO9Q_32370 [Pirellula sp.]